jgi:hypothetical protein
MKSRDVAVLATGVGVVAVVATLLVTGSGFWVTGKNKPKKQQKTTVEFAATADGNSLEVTQADCTGSTPQAKGCFKVKKGDAGKILFQFNETSPWTLKEITICKGSNKATTVCDLGVWHRMEFAVANVVINGDGDPEPGTQLFHTKKDGSIDLSQLTPGDEYTQFYLLDVNVIKQEYFYNIEACNGGSCDITLDPPLDNRGRD